jgi:hypothetical protein
VQELNKFPREPDHVGFNLGLWCLGPMSHLPLLPSESAFDARSLPGAGWVLCMRGYRRSTRMPYDPPV